MLCRSEVKAAVDVGGGVTYTVAYQNEQNTWVDITSSGGAEVGYINREYRVRFRFLMPENMAMGKPFDINFALNHQTSLISGINLTVADVNGTVLSSSSCSYDSLTTQDNSSYTKTYINIYGFRCTTATWVTLSFSYYSTSVRSPNTQTAGLITCGVSQFSIIDSSTDAQIIHFQNQVHNDLNDIAEQESQLVNDIINNQNEIATEYIEQQSEIASQAHSDSQTINNSIVEAQSQAHADAQQAHTDSGNILTAVGNVFTSVGDLISDFADFVVSLPGMLFDAIVDGLEWLFLPDMDELERYINQRIEDLSDATPLLASLLTIFQTIISGFNSGSVADSFTVPSFSIPLPDNVTWTFDSFTVPLFPSGLNDLLIPTRNFVAIVTSILIIRFVFFKLFSSLGFSGRDNPSEIDD